MIEARGAWLLLLSTALACEEEVVMSQMQPTPAGADAAAAVVANQDGGTLGKVDFQETAFAESERSRDPFRTFGDMVEAEERGQYRSQRAVVLDQYSIDELKLVGIVTRIQPPKAMLVDPTGRGHVIQRGQFVGRAEVVQAGGQSGATYEINWRVDRIREGDVVLVREDPHNPDVPSATRVLPLRPEGTIILGQ
jgi:type IV pilus assembly protein PilP